MAHLTVEELSIYLDRRLGDQARRQVESHLGRCQRCTDRLRGLQRVVAHLESVQHLAPPPEVDIAVRQVAALEMNRPRLWQLLERHAQRFTLQSSVLPIFAVVISLVLIAYLLSWGVYRQNRRGIPVILESGPTVLDGESSGTQTSDDHGVDAESARRLAGRWLDQHGDLWIERGLGSQDPVRSLPASDPVVQGWLEREPELGELARLGGKVRIRRAGEVWEIDFSAP